jgi:hypothetical protein
MASTMKIKTMADMQESATGRKQDKQAMSELQEFYKHKEEKKENSFQVVLVNR